ncbi:hypothetical protein U9M48_022379 [Paspalum notatum var. saurae]|uniref:Uncharacterized protein n=1 Tax=Paspalum notatum var. saurae TaxID=547442 RepID=A0AAQ3TJR4_PASNO
MEAYFLFHRGAAAAEEQEEDIGSASDSDSGSESPSTSRDGGSSAGSDDEDASSSSGSGRFEMAALMTQLPFKRGLSRFFDGKSQSFASLAAVGSLEDLPKPPRKRLKPSRSCGAGLDARRGRLLSPRRHCAKKATVPRSGGGAFPVLAVAAAAVAQRRPPPVARPEGVAGKALMIVS